jgi:Winged helix-turn helix
MSNDDVLFGFLLQLFALAEEIGVRPACRAMGVPHSTYYRWKRKVDRWGLEALRVRERRQPRRRLTGGCSLVRVAASRPRVGAEAKRKERTMDGNFTIGRFGGIEVRLHWSLLAVFA